LRILFAGTPEIAVPTLRALSEHFEVGAVLTTVDKPGSRGKTPIPSAVKEEALRLNLPVVQVEHLKGEARSLIASYGCDTLVCFAYGKLFGPKFLSLFSGEKLNIHPSLLPLLRGSSPIQGAILNQFSQTGISVQRIEQEMDSGDLLSSVTLALQGDETTESLTALVKERAALLAVESLHSLENGTASFTPQQGTPTYTQMITKDMAKIDWTLPAKAIHALVRTLYPWPKASTLYEGQVLMITSVYGNVQEAGLEPVPEQVGCGTVVRKEKGKGIAIATGSGLLWVNRLQLEKRKDLDWQSFLNGNRSFLETRLE